MYALKKVVPPQNTHQPPSMMFILVAAILLVVGVGDSSPVPENTGAKVAIPAGEEVQFKSMDSLKGTYEFGYDTGVGQAQSYRYENRTSEGKVYGKYGYIAPDGILREVHYVADAKGYRTFQINRYPVNSNNSPFIGPIPSRLKFS